MRPTEGAVAQEQVERLVALTTALADRMEQRPAGTTTAARDREARVALLRAAAEAGSRELAHRARPGPAPR